jgi:hypothetical protein
LKCGGLLPPAGSIASSKRVQRPEIFLFVMTQHIDVSVARANPKVPGGWTVPLIFNFFNFQNAVSDNKANWALIRFIAGIAFNFYLIHGA